VNGILVGLTMLVSSLGISPSFESSHAVVVPATFNFDSRESAPTSLKLPHGLLREQSRPVWEGAWLQPAAQTTPAPRCTKATRIVAVVAGAFSGWMVGGGVGGYIAAKPNDDGASMLRGVMIGAPIGAVVGGIFGYRLTK
jgi:hypothetical protein